MAYYSEEYCNDRQYELSSNGGFTFCGTDIADVGLSYAPELSDTYVYAPGETTVHDESFEGHHGGYFYGAYKTPKTLTLRCYFEEKNIDYGVMAKVYHLFRTGRQGKLVFSRRPWCYYYATVIDCAPEYSNYMNGIVKITMKAYYPFARSDRSYYEDKDPEYDKAMENTAFPNKRGMSPPRQFNSINLPTGEAKAIYLLNPGTERAQVGIEIKGTAIDGFTITNETTNQQCKFVAINNSGGDSYIYFDGMNGKTMIVDDEMTTLKMLYHDSGFIELKPSFPAVRELYVDSCANGRMNFITPLFDKYEPRSVSNAHNLYDNRYVYYDGAWYPIESIDITNPYILNIDSPCAYTPEHYSKAMVATLNKIVIRPVDSMNLSMLNFVFRATFA